MRKLRPIKFNDLKKIVDLVGDSSWVDIHVFYKNKTKLFLHWSSVAATACQ